MRTIGFFTTLLLGAAAAVAVVVGIESIPDIKRYIRIRDM
jgi:hypothetical protein